MTINLTAINTKLQLLYYKSFNLIQDLYFLKYFV